MCNTKKKVSIMLLVFLSALCLALGFQTFFAKKAYADTDVFYVLDGASIRINDVETSGLKFTANIDSNYYNALKEKYDVYEESSLTQSVDAGMTIVPTEYIVEASGWSVYAVKTWADQNELGVQLEDFNNHFKEEGSTLSYMLSLITIQDDNYTREFSPVAYIKIPAGNVDGATSVNGDEKTISVEVNDQTKTKNAVCYDGYYYITANYDSEQNSRSVYKVAHNAWGMGENDGIIKSYVDSVVELSSENGVHISNNITGENEYVSPHTVEKDENGDFNLNFGNNKVKAVLYNGVRQRSLPITVGDKTIYRKIVGGNNVGIDGNTVTFNTTNLEATTAEHIRSYNQEYVAFQGKYDVGTYLSVTFTGNNMPYVMFFANNINGKLANKYDLNTNTFASDDKGVLFTNGMVYKTNSGTYSTGNVGVYGPYRIDTAITNRSIYKDTNASYNNWWDPIQMSYLADNSKTNKDTTYTLIIGTEWDANGVLNVVEKVYVGTVDWCSKISGANEKPTYNLICENVDKTGIQRITNEDISAGSIILYSPFTGTGAGTDTELVGSGTATFSYTAPRQGFVEPQAIEMKGTKVNSNGEVTIKGQHFFLSSKTATMNKWGCGDNYYTALMGDYGVGTYIDTYFTGKTMPQVLMFGELTKAGDTQYGMFHTWGNGNNGDNGVDYERKGLVIINAGENDWGNKNFTDKLLVYGMNRINDNSNNLNNGTNAIAKFDAGEGLTISELADNVNYKYTVGTYLEDGKVCLQMILTNLDTNTLIANKKIPLNLTEAQVGTGYIAIHSPFTDVLQDKNVTYKLSAPYALSGAID